MRDREEMKAIPEVDYRSVICPNCGKSYMLPILVYGKAKQQLLEQQLWELVKKKEAIEEQIKGLSEKYKIAMGEER